MTSQDSPPDLPGNDGRWFLELTGTVDSEPTSTSSFATLENLELQAGVAAAVAAGTATATDEADETGEMEVTGATDAPASPDVAVAVSAAGDPLDDWQPDGLSRTLIKRKPFRWTVVAVTLIVVLAIVAGVLWLPRAAEGQATNLAKSYSSTLTDYRNVLPDTQAAVIVLADPESTENEIPGVIPAIADLQGHANGVSTMAAEPLPSTLPLVSRSSLEGLEPTRSSMVVLGTSGEDVAARIGHGYVYRTTVPEFFSMPDLPVEADTGTINQLSVDLASVLADTSSLASELPEDPLFVPVKTAATEAAERFAEWQLEYLEALRSDDSEAAATLLSELADARDTIEQANAVALIALGEEVNAEIIVLAGNIEATIASIPG
jgi:hypothetical protein